MAPPFSLSSRAKLKSPAYRAAPQDSTGSAPFFFQGSTTLPSTSSTNYTALAGAEPYEDDEELEDGEEEAYEMQEKSHTDTARNGTTRFADPEKQHQEVLKTERDPTLAPIESQTGSSRYASSEAGLTHKKQTWVAERKLLLKLDVVVLPLAMLLYLSAYLDRGNLGNARIQGLQDQVLRGSDTNYSLALSCFFITYIVFSIPGTLLAKAWLPSTSIACGALIWSIAASCQAATTNPAGLYVCRLFVGVGESMFGQSMALYFTFWYRKTEIAKRIGLFIACGALAGAFGGLIAYGVARIHHPSIEPWRILFLIEGCPSVLLAICVFLFLPSRPERSRYLTEDQRTLACTRLNADSLGEQGTGIDWRAVRRAFEDWKTYVVAVMYSCMNLGLGSVSGFLPTIIKGLGYSNADAQLYTVPPYAATVVFMYLLTTYSDHRQRRGIPAASVFIIGLVGWVILHSIDAKTGNMNARYFGCFCVVGAGYSAIPIIMSWQANNCASESQRAVSLGMLNTIGQCLSIAAAFLFPSHEGPQFVKGTWVNIAFQILGFCIAVGMTIYYRRENKRRDEAEGGRPPKGERLELSEKFDLSPGFRYVP